MERVFAKLFKVAAYTDIGPRKKTNQDSCCALVAKTRCGESALIAVCDGVGGLSSGELASGSMVHWLVTWFEESYPDLIDAWLNSPGEVNTPLIWAQAEWDVGLRRMNEALRTYGIASDNQLGTTCTAALLLQGRCLIAHVGDSRVYRFANNQMEILTQDQTWVAQEVALGHIAPEEARHHPKRNVILQSVGTQTALQPVYGMHEYKTGDAFMVCCDGFRNELFDDELVGAFGTLQEASEAEIEGRCKSLVDLVLARGETDNITAVAMSVQPGYDYGSTTQLTDKAGD